jgi:hypothetical protein
MKNNGALQKQESHWAYEVTADNKSVRDYADLEFRYIIFRKQALIGNKSGASKMVRKGGVARWPPLRRMDGLVLRLNPSLSKNPN